MQAAPLTALKPLPGSSYFITTYAAEPTMRWRRLAALLSLLPVTLLPRVAGAVLDLSDTTIDASGRVPLSPSRSFALQSYARIWHTVAPDQPLDRSRISIVYYAVRDERKLGVRLPEWGGGGTVGRNLIVIPVDRAAVPSLDLPRIVVHELTHCALERAYGRISLPRWFHEGLAMTLSGELSLEEGLTLSRAVFTRRLIALDSIDFVNRLGAAGATLAYSESHAAVEYLITTYGIDGIPDLLRSMRETGSFDTAFRKVFGFSTPEFDRMVRNHLYDRYHFLFLAGDASLLWFLAALLVIAAFIVIRIRNTRRKQRMDEEERTEEEAAAQSREDNGPEAVGDD